MRQWPLPVVGLMLALHQPADAQILKRQATLTGHASQVLSLAFSANGKALASCDEYRVVNLWEIAAGKKLRTIFPSRDLRCSPTVAFSGDGTRVGVCADSVSVEVFEVASGKQNFAIKVDKFPHGLAFSPDGQWVAVARHYHLNIMEDAVWQVALFRVGTGEKGSSSVPALETRRSLGGGHRFSGDGRMLAFAGRMVYTWECTTERPPRPLTDTEDDYRLLEFSPDAKSVAVARGNTVELWEVGSRKKRAAVRVEGRSELHDMDALGVALNMRLVASGDKDGNVTLWDLFESRKLVTFRAHSDRVTAVAFSADGKTLATGSFDKTVKVWDISKVLPR